MKKINAVTSCLMSLVFAIAGCKKESKTSTDFEKPSQKTAALVVNGKLSLPLNPNGKYIYEGDIVLSDEQAQDIIQKSKPHSDVTTESTFQFDFVKLWPGGNIYYVIDGDVPDQGRITAAMTDIQNLNANITFTARSSQPNYIRIKHTNNPLLGGQSSLGMVGGEQIILLRDALNAPKGVVIHEFFHALGILHEQSRADRDNYIIFHPQNTNPDFISQFNTYAQNNIDGFELGTFDFDSIMLYGSESYSIGSGLNSMTKLDGSTFPGQRDHISVDDATGISYLYKPSYYIKRGMDVVEQENDNDHSHGIYANYVEVFSDYNCTVPAIITNRLKLKTIVSYYIYSPNDNNNPQLSGLSNVDVILEPGNNKYYIGTSTTDLYYDFGRASGNTAVVTLSFDNMIGYAIR